MIFLSFDGLGTMAVCWFVSRIEILLYAVLSGVVWEVWNDPTSLATLVAQEDPGLFQNG